jgi:hypothetical protein
VNYNELAGNLTLTAALTRYQCAVCLWVSTDPNLLHWLTNDKGNAAAGTRCPNCSDTAHTRGMFPHTPAMSLQEMARAFYSTWSAGLDKLNADLSDAVFAKIGRRYEPAILADVAISTQRRYRSELEERASATNFQK